MANSVYVVGICLFSALGALLFGLDIGYIAPILEDPYFKRDVAHLPDWENPQSFIDGYTAGQIVSSFAIGCICTSFPAVSGYLLDVWGRRTTIILGSFVCILGFHLQASSHSVMQMLFGRFVTGAAIGVFSCAVPLYQSEVAPAELRGALTTLYELLLTFGIFVAALVDYSFLGVEGGWRKILWVLMVPAVVLMAGGFYLPRSPRWLVQQGRHEEASQVLHSLRSETEAVRELDEIKLSQRRAEVMGEVRWSELLGRRAFQLLSVGMAVQVLQQLQGINFITFYGPRIFKQLGLNVALFMSLSNLVLFLATIPGVFLVEKAGRRILLIASAVGMLVPDLVMGVIGTMCKGGSDALDLSSNTAAITVVSGIFIFTVNFAYGWGPLSWVYCAEMFPLRTRSRSVGMTTMANWIGTLLVAQFSPMLFARIGFSTFYVLAAFSTAALALSLWLPETKGVPLESIDKIWDTKLSNRSLLPLSASEDSTEKSESIRKQQYGSLGK